ncbi:MAG: zinc ABC transporter substrate-binding protein [Pseudomonadota bacterium]
MMVRVSKRALSMLAAIALVGSLMAAPSVAAQDAAEPINVVATTGMVADAANAVGGDRVSVRALMGPGIDPHAYRQTRSDIAATTKADLVLRHGLYLEAQMEAFFDGLSNRVPVVAVAEGLPVDSLLAHDTYQDKYDPHVWMDPDLWADVVDRVRDALIDVDPDHRDEYTANAAAYIAELEDLKSYADTVLSTVPDEQRVLVTAHDAFSYFGQAHGFEVLGIQGISTESEAGLNRIRALVDELVEREIGAVFVETSVSDRNIRALIEGAQASGHEVIVGGELFSDAMGTPGTYEGTYLGMIDHNVSTITDALGGEIPEGGRLGRLGEGERG